MREIEVPFKLSDEQEKELSIATEKFSKLAKSRGKKGFTEEQIFILAMNYGSMEDIDEKLNFWEMLTEAKAEDLTGIIDKYCESL